MNDNTEKAEEKLLASMSNSQDGSKEGATPQKTAVSRKRASSSTTQAKSTDENNELNTRVYETRNIFVGRLRWPD